MVDGTSKAAFPLCYPAKGRAPLKVGASKSSPSMHSHVSWRSDCCGYSLPSRRDLVEPLVYAILSLLAVSICHLFWVLLFDAALEGEKSFVSPVVFARTGGLSFNYPRFVAAFRPAYALRWSYHILATERWTAYGIWLRTSSWHTLKHTRDANMRCFKDIATRAGQAEAEAAQYAQLVRFMHIPRQEFIGAKSDFDLLGVLVDIRQVMETVAVWHSGNS